MSAASLSQPGRCWLRWTPAMDAQGTDAYRLYVGGRDRQAIAEAAKRLELPRWRITRRGVQLGLARAKEKPWSEAEVRLLRENMHYGVDEISRRFYAAGYPRSPAAVLVKRKRLCLTTRNGAFGYTANALARLLGVDSHAVYPWIARGMLPAERCLTLRLPTQGGDQYWIRRSDVRSFAFRFPELIDTRKLDGVWFIELLRDDPGASGGSEEETLP